MAVFKMTTLFQYASGASNPNLPLHRTGGWSESWYATGNVNSDIINLFNGVGLAAGRVGFWKARAVLLPVGTGIIGFRIQSVSPIGPIQTGALSLVGPAGQLADTPQTALLIRSPAIGANNIRRWTIRGVPDVQITEGEYQPGGSFGAGVPLMILELAGLQFRGRDLTQPSLRIVSITAVGLVNLEVPYTGAVNDMVRILRTVDAGKNLKGGRFQVTAIGPGNSVTLNTWPYGATTLGSLRKDAVVYPQVDYLNTSVARVIIKKVGRPFVGYRGRRSKRRA